jgi:hypothetical protein
VELNLVVLKRLRRKRRQHDIIFMGKMKVVTRRFISSSTERRRTMDGSAWSDGAPGSCGDGFNEQRRETIWDGPC